MSKDLYYENIVKEIDFYIKKIWNKPPSEIENLLDTKNVFQQPFNLVIYSYGDTNALAGILWVLRKSAKAKKNVSLNNLIIITTSILDAYAISFEAYGLLDTAKLLRSVSEAILQLKETREYIVVIERLTVYLNRLGMAGWLDLLIPWQKLDSVFKSVHRIKGNFKKNV